MRDGRFPTFEDRSANKRTSEIIYKDDDLEEDPDILISTIRTHGRFVTTEPDQLDSRARIESFDKHKEQPKLGFCAKLKMIGSLCRRPLALDSAALED